MPPNIPAFLEGLLRSESARGLGSQTGKTQAEEAERAQMSQQILDELRQADISRTRQQGEAVAQSQAEVGANATAFRGMFPELAKIKDDNEVNARGTLLREDQLNAQAQQGRLEQIGAQRTSTRDFTPNQRLNQIQGIAAKMLESQGVTLDQLSPEQQQQVLQSAQQQLEQMLSAAQGGIGAPTGAPEPIDFDAVRFGQLPEEAQTNTNQLFTAIDSAITESDESGLPSAKDLEPFFSGAGGGQVRAEVRRRLIEKYRPLFEEGGQFADPGGRPAAGIGLPFVGEDANRFRGTNTVEAFVDEILGIG